MLSYRHAFHAGNHADVLKHLIEIQLLRYLAQKDKPFWFIDTHAGAGGYSLDSGYAAQNTEYETGIALLWDRDVLPEPLADYVALVKNFNPDGQLKLYPGSPLIALELLRKQDKMRLFELHPAEFEALQSLFRSDRRVKVEQEDGFRALPSLLPPAQRRALVLIDPSYEVKQDYATVVTALQAAWRRFPTGIYLLWYPVVRRASIDRLERDLEASGMRDVLLAELSVAPAGRGGMQTSGLIIVNPPWTLKPQLPALLQFLAGTLGLEGQGSYRVEALVEE